MGAEEGYFSVYCVKLMGEYCLLLCLQQSMHHTDNAKENMLVQGIIYCNEAFKEKTCM